MDCQNKTSLAKRENLQFFLSIITYDVPFLYTVDRWSLGVEW